MTQAGDTYGVDLEFYRRSLNLSYQGLAAQLGLTTKEVARRYCIGERRPPADVEQRILVWSEGRVSLYAMLDRRIAFARAQEVKRAVSRRGAVVPPGDAGFPASAVV